MRVYSIGEVCKLLGLKPHVLRYWEQEFELISPRKSASGHRIYTNHDLQLLFRIRYLLYEKRFTIEGAKKRIWEELAAGDLNLKSIINETRSLLLDSLAALKELKSFSDKK